jgi:hypothetical protein
VSGGKTGGKTENTQQRLGNGLVLAVEAVICELVSVSPFPVLRENTGKFAEFRRRTTIGVHLVVEIQSLTSRIP